MSKEDTKKKEPKSKKKKEKVSFTRTVQEAIPFLEVMEDGILKLSNTKFSKMYKFNDSNFITEQEEQQEDILDDYSKLLNKFQPNVTVEIVIVNKRSSMDELKAMFHLKEENDNLNDYREDYNQIIDEKITEGRNDIRKDKYIVLTADISDAVRDISAVSAYFATLQTELSEGIQAINRTGVKEVSSFERMNIMHYIYNGVGTISFEQEFGKYNMDGNLDSVKMKQNATTAKNMIAPHGIKKLPKDILQLGENRLCKSYMLSNMPNSLDTKFLSDISNIPCEMVTTVSFNPVPRKKAIRDVKMQNNAIKADVYQASVRATKNGIFDKDLAVNENLQQAQEEAKKMRNDVIRDGKKLFFTTVTISIFADDEKEMKENMEFFSMKCNDYSITPNALIGQQMAGLKTASLTGEHFVALDYVLTSDSACAFFPFNIQELMDANGHFYGINSYSKNMIMYDRRTSDLPNGIILGRSGSGKSFITKGEIIPNLLDGNDDVIILDPDGEYVVIANTFGGTVVDLENKADIFINPCDMSMEYSDPKADPLSEKCDFMVGLVEAMLGRETNAFEVNAIHRCTKRMYESYIAHMDELREAGSTLELDTEACPTLVDFYEELLNDSSAEGNKLAMCCEPYCIGNYNLFAHKTNVEGRPRFLVYNLKKLPEKMREVAMKVCLTNIWTRVVENKEVKKATWIYLDEFYLLMKTEASATTLQTYFKRIRKYFGIMTGITQDIEDLVKTSQGRGMIENAGFLLIMNQSPTGRANVQNRYQVSNALIDNIKDKPAGYGLIYTGKSIVPFNYKLPTNTKLYKLMSTKPTD